jgi:hypothetical protein
MLPSGLTAQLTASRPTCAYVLILILQGEVTCSEEMILAALYHWQLPRPARMLSLAFEHSGILPAKDVQPLMAAPALPVHLRQLCRFGMFAS